MLLCVLGFFGAVFAFKVFIFSAERKMSKKFENPIVTISAIQATESIWHLSNSVVGSTRTVEGVDITTEASGMIKEIYFEPGSDVKKNDVLVKLNIAPDIARLHELEASATLAEITDKRDRKQYSFGAVSKEQVDTDDANKQSTAADVEQQKAIIDKKIIRAPFSGRLGISAINLGEYINSGQKIVSLQTIDPIYVDFYLPQQQVADIGIGQAVQVTSDRDPGKIFSGKVTTVNPIVNSDIRNIEVEATLPNPKGILLPGMFTKVSFNVGESKQYITLPQMAITFNPYGALIYILKKTTQKFNGKTVWKAEQQFVVTGKTRGNQIAVLKGINVGDTVVTSGQLKLKNGSLVVIDNTLSPSNNPTPTINEEE